MLKFLAVTAALILASCTASAPSGPPTLAQATFQNGQVVQIKLDPNLDPALKTAFENWVAQGVYTNSPVYRKLPGIFLLTGKPRLAGYGFQSGVIPTPNPKGKTPPSTTSSNIGLVVHADGTVGPELILQYGIGVVSCCEAPQNIRIGILTKGALKLHQVERGDNLQNIVIESQ